MPNPDILFVTTDQQRWDWSDLVPTAWPHLRALAAAGQTWTNAWAASPMCVPARFSWYTGLHASQGRRSLLQCRGPWADAPYWLPALLRDCGYRTVLFGKLHAHGPDASSDLRQQHHRDFLQHIGFTEPSYEVGGRSLAYTVDCAWTQHLAEHGLLERYREDIRNRTANLCWNEPYRVSVIPAEHQVDTLIADRACDWLTGPAVSDDQRPFFAHVSLCGPHFPLDPPQGWFGRHDPASMPKPAGLKDPEEVAYWQQQRAAYSDLSTFVDEQIGRVLAALPRPDNTLVVFTSDHGDRLGDSGSWHKSQPEDGSCRVPMVVRWPGQVTPGSQTNQWFSAVDLAPSIAAVIDAGERFAEIGGLGSACLTTEREDPGGHYAETAGWRMWVDDTWKYIFYTDGSERLHHRGEDLNDIFNQAEQQPAILAASVIIY